MNKTSAAINIIKPSLKYFITSFILIYSCSVLAIGENYEDFLKPPAQALADNIPVFILAEVQGSSPTHDGEDSEAVAHPNSPADIPEDSPAEGTEPLESQTEDTLPQSVPVKEQNTGASKSSEASTSPQNSADNSEDASADDSGPAQKNTESDIEGQSSDPSLDDEGSEPVMSPQNPADSTGSLQSQPNDSILVDPETGEASALSADESQSPADDDAISEKKSRHAFPMTGDRRVRKIDRGKTEIQAEIEYETTYDATDPNFEKDEFLARVKSYTNYGITEKLSLLLNLDLIFDGEKQLFSQASRFLDHEGLNVDLLKLEYKNDWLSLFGGRYEPADEIFPNVPAFFGNYSHYIDLDEKIGFGGGVKLGETSMGEHWLTTHLFHLDTSFLSSPLFTEKGRIEKEDGGVSNTEKFNNYLITLNGGKIYDEPFSYVMGHGVQQAGIGRDLDEEMFIGGLYGYIKPSEDYDIELALEHVNLENAGGFPEDHSTITLGAFYSRWPWGIGTAYSERRVKPHDATDDDRTDKIFEIVGRYFIGDHFGIETAFEILEENNEDEHLFGIVLIYYFNDIHHSK